ncbi:MULTISPECIES: type IV pili methyl-accepting chemotaxis transducer N-terminal domain-containing protein [Ramlibacter]|uniref:type IV pili methyl-accepting chemotaxis transducer N-terminal domain-containing protein n=1 Tax=Ramlibacter TaxID=174951 RepID=UPI0015EE85D8|nr:type IV pili methyl-accepting chemotaxis transducer N-terminal domain-containing protein [Ramlibacter sp. CGMCC 1.13660]
MTSLLLLHTADAGVPPLADDARRAGFDVPGVGECANLVREALRLQPDAVLCWMPRPDDAFLQAIATLQSQQRMPLLVFTDDASAEPMQRALDAGVHAWVVQGYAARRLRPLVQLAVARAAHEGALRERVAELSERLEERKLVDQAKGILMRASRVSEQEAFTLLRSASMQGNQRVGQVSRQVIDAARLAQAINQAGQQRMLSQRLVKLYALACAGTEAAAANALVRESIARVETNLAGLQQTLSPETFGDLLEAAQAGWGAMRALLERRPETAALAELDDLAEAVLEQAEALVSALESSGLARTVGIVNMAGKQRMLSQRMAKLALLAAQPALAADVGPRLELTRHEVDGGLAALAAAPLAGSEIAQLLERGRTGWQALLQAVPRAGQAGGRTALAATSEELLDTFERLTTAYQHSIQVLMG